MSLVVKVVVIILSQRPSRLHVRMVAMESFQEDAVDLFALLDQDEPPEARIADNAPRDIGMPQLSLLDSFARPEAASSAQGSVSMAADPHVQVVDPELIRRESCDAAVAPGAHV